MTSDRVIKAGVAVLNAKNDLSVEDIVSEIYEAMKLAQQEESLEIYLARKELCQEQKRECSQERRLS